MFQILAYANRLQEEGKPIIRLEIGDTSGNADSLLLEKLRSTLISEGNLAYSPSAGERSLRRAFARVQSTWKSQEICEKNVVVTPANAAVSQIFNLLADPGDTVLMPDPCFPTYRLAADFSELRVVNFTLAQENQFQPDLEQIRLLIQGAHNPRILIVDSPSNPLGISHPPALLDELGLICRQNGVSLVVDETYRNLIYDPADIPMSGIKGATYIYSISKDAGAPGMRMGFVTGSEELVSKIADYNSLFYSCLPKPLQLAAQMFLEDEKRSYSQVVALYKSKSKLVSNVFANQASISFVEPNASIYFFLNVSKTGLSGDDFSLQLLNEKSVCVCPGYGFGPSGRDYIRVSIAVTDEDLQEGCERILALADSLASQQP